jgi:acyl carrier protein
VSDTNLPSEGSARIRQLVGELAPEPTGPPPAEAALVADLGYNSLALAELAIAIADEFGLDSTHADDLEPFLEVETVADIERLLSTMVGPAVGQ